MLFYALQIIVSLLALYYYRNNRLRYFSMVTMAYFISFYALGSFDVPLTLYCIFIIIGAGKTDSISFKETVLCIWILVYFIVGILFQKSVSAVSSLVTRYAFIVICIYINCVKIKSTEWFADASDFRFAVKVGLFTEGVIIALVWSSHGIGARVVTNNQPIGAGMVIGLMAIIGWCYLEKHFSAVETMFYSILSTIIVLLSGTRGYMVIIALALIAILAVYLLDIPENGKNCLPRIGFFLVIISIVFAGVLLIDQDVLVQLLRLDAGLGYRENENIYVQEIMKVAPWYNQLFGFGMGGTANHLDEFLSVARDASWNREWMFYRLMNKKTFHNYWYTVIYQQGIIGFAAVLAFFITIIKKVLRLNTSGWFRFLLAMLIIGNMISQTYRITATCSIFEMVLIMYFIKFMESRDALSEMEMKERRLK